MDDIKPSEITRPTWCRWYIVGLATMMSIMLYLDRFCWSFAKTLIQEDVGITSAQADYCLSCFFWAYSLAQIPSGWLSDRWGARLMLALYIFSWSVFTVLIGWSASWIMLMAMQLGHGLGQAGAYPTSASMLSRWMPISTRGTASSIVAFGGRAGGAIAPILTAWLIVAFVPVSTSSLLAPKQLLAPGVSSFAWNLEQSLRPNTGATIPHRELTQHIHAAMPTKTWDLIERLSKSEQERRDASKAAPEQTASSPPPALTAEEAQELTDALNLAIKEPTLATPEILEQLNLDLEAKQLLTRRDAGNELTQPEIERVNRLVLEKAFPTVIGKVYVQGWRHVYTVYGLVGMFIAVMFYLVVRNRPEEHPACNIQEVELIREGRPAQAASTGPQPSLPWKKILSSLALWLSSLSQFCTNIGWLFVTAKLPEYLETVHFVEISRRSWMSSWPMIAGIAGMLLGGRLTDRLRVRVGLRWSRSIPMGLTKVGAAAAYIGCIFAQDPVTAALLCAAVAFFTDLGVAATWAFVQDAGGRYVGVVLGFGNMWGNIGAAVAPIIYGLAVESTKNYGWSKDGWNTCFIMCAGAMIISGMAGIMIDATKPIIGEEPESPTVR